MKISSRRPQKQNEEFEKGHNRSPLILAQLILHNVILRQTHWYFCSLINLVPVPQCGATTFTGTAGLFLTNVLCQVIYSPFNKFFF